MSAVSTQNSYQKVLFITPPMTQLNTPYPASTVLMGFLKSQNIACTQADFSIELALKLFSKQGLTQVFEIISAQKKKTEFARFFCDAFEDYAQTIDPLIAFLQGKDSSLATRIAARNFLPEGPRFLPLQDELTQENISASFGKLGQQDKAKYIASLYLDDLADLITENIDPQFQLSRYGEKLAASQPSFDFLEKELLKPPTLVSQFLETLTFQKIYQTSPTVVCLSAPFPGNVLGALRIAKNIRKNFPSIKIIFGGGYANTELRKISDPKIFEYIDFITLDDGERPLLTILEYLNGSRQKHELVRTFLCENKNVQWIDNKALHDIPQNQNGFPTYEGLLLDQYISMLELLNPMHRIWSDGRWNKLTLAHGCYWKKCNFCDINLDYIGRYEPSKVDLLVERIERLIAETGHRGFHFVDEAAPPALLEKLARKLIEKRISISWWGNIRFEKAFTPELAGILADSGCIAVSGGLEVASNRLLALMNKGVSVEQVALVTKAFTDAGVLVHAYLMYGFPSQTTQETVDALERVRQLFSEGCIQSAYWHRFSATVHSPIGKDPKKFGLKLLPTPQITFAENDLAFEDAANQDQSLDLEMLGAGLKKALYNYMHGIGLEEDVRFWFDAKVPKTTVAKNLLRQSL